MFRPGPSTPTELLLPLRNLNGNYQATLKKGRGKPLKEHSMKVTRLPFLSPPVFTLLY